MDVHEERMDEFSSDKYYNGCETIKELYELIDKLADDELEIQLVEIEN